MSGLAVNQVSESVSRSIRSIYNKEPPLEHIARMARRGDNALSAALALPAINVPPPSTDKLPGAKTNTTLPATNNYRPYTKEFE